MLLNRELVCSPAFQRRGDVLVPDPALLALPEKAVQFGTGAFLRGFVEYFLDEANRRGCFGGRIVAVGSTGSGRDQLLNRQDGLFTLSVQGMVDGVPRQERRIIASLSRCISAHTNWPDVLECARNPDLELIFSNTTEVGIELDESDAAALDPPRSFPGKLTRFLYERARTFDFAPTRGAVVLPCELIEDNGDRLRAIVLTLAEQWKLEAAFAHWLRESVTFCNTLVDRIVSAGALIEEDVDSGYRDDLLTTCEPYRLFVIQGDASLQKRLRFTDADAGILVTPHIEAYRERKVGLLNATHTIMVPLALLCGFETVADATQDVHVGAFVRRTMLDEIAPGLDVPDAEGFAREVLDRFANPFVRHALFDITLQGTMKMRVRVVPSLLRYAQRTGRAPSSHAFGFAAYLLFMRGDLQDGRRTAGLAVPQDDQGARVSALWRSLAGDHSPDRISALVAAVCADESLWGTDLGLIPGFVDSVAQHLIRAHRDGVSTALAAHLAGETAAVA
jgi:tagaturonate reductase